MVFPASYYNVILITCVKVSVSHKVKHPISLNSFKLIIILIVDIRFREAITPEIEHHAIIFALKQYHV